MEQVTYITCVDNVGGTENRLSVAKKRMHVFVCKDKDQANIVFDNLNNMKGYSEIKLAYTKPEVDRTRICLEVMDENKDETNFYFKKGFIKKGKINSGKTEECNYSIK
jgi:hypothetical protein